MGSAEFTKWLAFMSIEPDIGTRLDANAAALGALIGRVESTLGGRPPRIGARLVEWFRDDARDHAAIAGMLQTFKPKVRP